MLLCGEEEIKVDFPKVLLPPGAGEGSRLRISLELEPEGEREERERIGGLLKRLKDKSE